MRHNRARRRARAGSGARAGGDAGERARAPAHSGLLPQLLAATLLTAISAASAQPPCIVAAGASTFNLTELGGGSAPIFTATEPYRRGWVYMFSLCGDVAPDAYCTAAPPAAVLQDTPTQCHTLGASATRVVVVTANGISVSFSGGEGGRKSIIMVECADVEKPFLVSWTEGLLLLPTWRSCARAQVAQSSVLAVLRAPSAVVRRTAPALGRETAPAPRDACARMAVRALRAATRPGPAPACRAASTPIAMLASRAPRWASSLLQSRSSPRSSSAPQSASQHPRRCSQAPAM